MSSIKEKQTKTFNLLNKSAIVDLSLYDSIFKYHKVHGSISLGSIHCNLENALDYDTTQIRATLQSYSSFTLPTSCTQLLSGDNAYILKLIEDILILVRDLHRSVTKADYVLSIVTFTKLRSTKPFSQLLVEQWDKLMGVVLQSEESTVFTNLRDILENYNKVKVLPVFKKLYKFLMYCIGTSLFDKLGVKFNISRFVKIEKAAIKKEYFMGPDFVYCILDTALFMCETGYQCMVTGSLSPIFHHETSYEKWLKDCEELKLQSKFLSNPEPHGFTIFDFLSRLDNCIEKGEGISKYQNPRNDKDPDFYNSGAKICKYMLNELKLIRGECLTKRLAQQDRKAPFALLVAGGSSVGKSTFTKMLYYHFGRLFKLPIDPEYRYVRNPFDQYWTNFNSSQWCVQLDDIAFLHPNKSTGCDPSLMEMLQVVNNVPYVPTQADLADKGRTPLRSRFVVATTNTEHMNAEQYFSCPLAVQRRLPYVVNIMPKKEYTKDGCMLDTSTLPKVNEGEYPDFWKIIVKKVVPLGRNNTHMGQSGELKTIHIFDTVVQFLKWFNEVAKEAEGTQIKSMSCDENMSNCLLCDCGIPLKSCAEHYDTLQSDEIVIYQGPWIQEMSRRHNLNDNIDMDDQDPGYSYMMNGIMKEIKNMSIMTRLLVWWYAFLLWLINYGPKMQCLMAFFFGRWYFYLILCRIMHIPECRQIAFKLMGYRAYISICRNKQAVICCAAIATAVTMYKAYSFLSDFKQGYTDKMEAIQKQEEHIENHPFIYESKEGSITWLNGNPHVVSSVQGISEERGESPKSVGDKKENVWYKDNYECTNFDVTPSTLSKANWSIDDLIKIIENNCVYLRARVRTVDNLVMEKRTRATCIGGRVYVLNNHAIPFPEFELEIISHNSKDGITTNCKFLITQLQYQRIPNLDIMLISLPLPPKRDIRHLFAKESFKGRFDGLYFARNSDGSFYKNQVIAPYKEFHVHKEPDVISEDIASEMWHGKPRKPTEYGDCGSLLIVKSTMGPVILGMHAVGTNIGTSYALSLTNEFLMDFDIGMVNNNPVFQVGEYKQELIALDKKSPVRYIEEGSAQVYGSFAGFRGKMKSRVKPTLMSELAIRNGYIKETGPPVMNSWVPWHHALKEMTRPVTHINLTIVEICKDAFIKDILTGLSQADLDEVKVYDNLTAINGKPGLAYVDKLNRNTSAGFPFRKSKKYFLDAIDAIDDMQHPVKATKEIMQEVDEIIRKYEAGEIYAPVFTGSLKDEPVSKKKQESGKTRVFCGAPMPWTIVVRKYLLSIIRLIQKNRFLFESGPGTIAQSDEWDQIYKYLIFFGVKKIIAGDYEKFDKRMPASIILAAFDIIIAILKAAKWTEREIRVVFGIAEDTAFPNVDLRGDFMRFYGTNPSGHPLTVIINGLANCLYVRYCYFILHPEHRVDDFKENVHCMTYGDDLIMGVSDKCPWFNHTTMQEVLKSIDIGFTMADKEAESKPYIDIDDATFLRRSWRFEPELGKYVCPIEHASIDKMMTMCVESKTISMELHAIEVMNTAVREYFWYGRKVFEMRRNLMLSFVDELDLRVYYEREFPTWDQLVQEYQHYSSLRT